MIANQIARATEVDNDIKRKSMLMMVLKVEKVSILQAHQVLIELELISEISFKRLFGTKALLYY